MVALQDTKAASGVSEFAQRALVRLQLPGLVDCESNKTVEPLRGEPHHEARTKGSWGADPGKAPTAKVNVAVCVTDGVGIHTLRDYLRKLQR